MVGSRESHRGSLDRRGRESGALPRYRTLGLYIAWGVTYCIYNFRIHFNIMVRRGWGPEKIYTLSFWGGRKCVYISRAWVAVPRPLWKAPFWRPWRAEMKHFSFS